MLGGEHQANDLIENSRNGRKIVVSTSTRNLNSNNTDTEIYRKERAEMSERHKEMMVQSLLVSPQAMDPTFISKVNEKLCYTENNSGFSSATLDDLKVQIQQKSHTQGKTPVPMQKLTKKRITSFIDSSSPPNVNYGIKSANSSEARPAKQKLSGQQA